MAAKTGRIDLLFKFVVHFSNFYSADQLIDLLMKTSERRYFPHWPPAEWKLHSTALNVFSMWLIPFVLARWGITPRGS